MGSRTFLPHTDLFTRACAFCADMRPGSNSASLGGVHYCSRCMAALFRGFDPEPGTTVTYIDGEQAQFRVIERYGDWLTVEGPSGKRIREHRNCLAPGDVMAAIQLGLRARAS